MKKSLRKTLLMHSMKILELMMNVVLFYIAWNLFLKNNQILSQDLFVQILVPASYAVLVTLLVRIYNAFDIGMSRVSEVVYSLTLADIIAGGFFYIMICMSSLILFNPLPVLGLIAVQVTWNIGWAFSANKLYFRLHAPKETVIIYERDEDLYKLEEIHYFSSKFNVQKRIKDPVDIDQVIREIAGYKVIFVSGIPAELRNDIVKYCVERGLHTYIVPLIGDIVLAAARHMKRVSIPILRIRRAAPHPEFLFIKRTFDIVASLMAIIIAAPIMIITAILIKLYDGGPVFYKQVRLTRDRKEFKIIKFRSMRVDAERDGVARLARENDDRITPIGKLIRMVRFDELPQLFNILGGSMTIVGPRPERPELSAEYERVMPSFGLRLQVKAGLTGYAQVYGRYNTEPSDKLKMDLMYINNMSVAEDFKLIFATIKILFMSESTEGVEEGQTTAIGEKSVQNK